MSLGFVFPGQGAQEVGMLSDHAAKEPIIIKTFEIAQEAVGLPLWELVCKGPEEELNKTAITQPALLAASVALWRLWQSRGGANPDIVAGHSLGEYSALVCAGSLDFSDAVRLVHARGKFMQDAVPLGKGSMAAILGLADDLLAQACTEAASETNGIVAPANFNSPGQVVIAGSTSAVAAAMEKCQNLGARRAVQLAVSAPFHCQLMQPAAENFAKELEKVTINQPHFTLVQNTDAAITTDVQSIRKKLIDQIAQPVRWTECVQTMINAGMDNYVECGPGKVLSGLIRRIDRKVGSNSLATLESFDSAINT
ncbi:MAG: ACP S-malonyltransferase [Pseudomonadales bacterium]|nr:ACP S-malonyltransferase [Pseudomonadales bacterium]